MLSLSKIQEEFMPATAEEKEKTKTEYEYDKEWLRRVLIGKCPECEGELEKKGIKRACIKNQHLEIYGNPITVAYNKIKTVKDLPALVYNQCPECGSTEFYEDIDRHETYCKCGLVLAGPYQYGVKYAWHDNYLGVGSYSYHRAHTK
jgi:hypothetical protein